MNEQHNHRSCLKKFAEDWSCHHCQISRGLPKERTTSHKHCPWPPRPRLSCLRSDKASSILSMECIPFNGNAAFWLSLGLYLNLSIFFIKHLYVFLSRKHIIQWIGTLLSRERKLDFQILTYVSLSICCISTVSWISMRFTGIGQLYILYTFTKTYANQMSASNWLLCPQNGHYLCMHKFADKRTQWPTLFREWFRNNIANRHEICTRLRQHVKIKFWGFYLNLSNFNPWN